MTTKHPDLAPLTDAAARAGGAALAAATSLGGRLRPAAKPLHPRGVQLSGIFDRVGAAEGAWGVPWLDDGGSDPVVVRLSRSVGLPATWPDVLGLAARIGSADPIDLLFASGVPGRISRFLLVPRRSPETWYGTLMPYRTPSGPVLFGARLRASSTGGDPASDGAEVQVFMARPRSDWSPFGAMRLQPATQPADPPLSFDPVLNAPPGLPPYRWARQLRERSYAAARRTRGGSGG